jgi:hypothetical protein
MTDDAADNRRNPNGAGKHRRGARSAAAVALASGLTHKAAAGQAGIGSRTLRDWLREPEFRARVERIRAAMVGRAIGKVSRQLARNIDRLSEIAEGKDERAAVAAMRALLDHWKTLRESGELSDQVRELLARLEGGK